MAQLFWPFDPSLINYGFGNAPGYGGFHNGVDFAVGQGTPLIATASGVIRNNDAGAVDGAGVDITTDDGWKVRMWHVSAFLVPNGSQVVAGQVVALSGGAKGTWGAGNATGPHLHWGVAIGRKGNDYNWVNPASLNPETFGNVTPDNKTKDDENMGLCIVANSEEAGHFAVYSDADGWKNLNFGGQGSAEMRGYQKIADALARGIVPVAVLSGEEFIYTQSHATKD